MKRILFLVLLPTVFFASVFIYAESMYSPTWGFFIDLPEGYAFTEGDGRDRFSFTGPMGLKCDLVVYDGRFESIQDLVIDINKKISNQGLGDYFKYHDKNAAIIDLEFDDFYGFGLCIELAPKGGRRPMLTALAYGPKNIKDMELFHISALDSISPSVAERLTPGPVMHYSFPRGEIKNILLKDGIPAMIYEKDAQIAQTFIEREFAVLAAYVNTDHWKAAWYRYYRLIFRDSFDRIVNPALALANAWGGVNAKTAAEKRAFAQRALNFVQGFEYERDLSGSDFINLVTAITEMRGDCDPRAMLWAVILTCADIRAGIMVSRQYSHAMGMADIEGTGARFEAFGVKWLVAETTSDVELGLIAQEVSDPRHWIGVVFE